MNIKEYFNDLKNNRKMLYVISLLTIVVLCAFLIGFLIGDYATENSPEQLDPPKTAQQLIDEKFE